MPVGNALFGRVGERVRLAGQARDVVVVDVAGLAVENVQHVRGHAPRRVELLANAVVGDQGGLRTPRIVLDQQTNAPSSVPYRIARRVR